jgi:hypothetical protein
MARALAWILLPLAGLLAGFVLWGFPEYVPDPTVIIPAARIIEMEPPEVVRWRDRIVYRYIGPTQVAMAPGGAVEAVATFCKPLVVVDTVVVERQVLLRSGVTHDGWFLARGRVELVGLANTGDLIRFTFPTRPGWDFRTSGDSVLLRYPRWSLVRQGAEIALPALLGLAVGAWIR